MAFSPKLQGDTQPTLISVTLTTGAIFIMTGATLGTGANGNGSFLAYLRDPLGQTNIALSGTWSGLNASAGQVQYNWVAGDTTQVAPGSYLFIVKITIGGVLYIPKPAQLVIQAS